jgi:hypothetical protein
MPIGESICLVSGWIEILGSNLRFWQSVAGVGVVEVAVL